MNPMLETSTNMPIIRAARRDAANPLITDAIDAMLRKGTPFTYEGNLLNADERRDLLALYHTLRKGV